MRALVALTAFVVAVIAQKVFHRHPVQPSTQRTATNDDEARRYDIYDLQME